MCNVLPKQSAGLFRRTGSTKTMCCLWGKTLVFPHTPLALFGRFDCAPARRVAALRAEVSPDGDEGAALDSQGGLVPLDSRLGVAVS